ncbi:MAG: DUF1552 domain-containing protein [Verrucomicrobia bacterium]|nr:DUF1552 domain-containing protein [Verrucomicrobiota bacterium]
MNTMSQPSLVDRRTFLKGVGVSLALPFFDSFGWAAGAIPTRPPVRLAFMYMPHGVIMNQFWPKSQEEFLSAAPPIIRSLQPLMDQCLMMKGISGVSNAPFPGAPHALELSTWLTARLPDADSRDRINISISADQIMANYVGAQTLLPSLELATMPQTWKENQEGLHEGYYNHCSYRSPTQPVPAETDPRNVLNRLFGKRGKEGKVTQANPLDRQMLDRVLGGARDLRRNLARGDQQKLDEYLDSVRSVERRIAAIETRQQQAALEKNGVAPSQRHATDSAPIEVKIPEGDKRSEYMQVMCDLTILAFQTDTTRVSTYISSRPNGASYPELGFSDQHHSQTHYGADQEMIRKVAAINKLNVDQFAYMVKKMHALKEGDGTLLDHSIMLWGSGLEDGDKHKRDNLPFIIAGKGGGSLKTGLFLSNIQGNQGDLLTTLLSCAGVPLDRPIGIATKQITEMKA